MRLDIEISSRNVRTGEQSATIRVEHTPARPTHRDEPPEVDDFEVIDAWFGDQGADAMATFRAFNVDLETLFADEIQEAFSMAWNEQAEGLAEHYDDEAVFLNDAAGIHENE